MAQLTLEARTEAKLALEAGREHLLSLQNEAGSKRNFATSRRPKSIS